MKLEESLTILCSLKGREQMTERFLDWCRFIKCPFPIVLADGSKYSKEYDFSELNVDYFWNGYDETILDFNNKMSNAIDRVKTPFFFMPDNDDFFYIPGIIEHIKFLEENPDFNASRGTIRSIQVNGNFVSFNHSIFNKPGILDDDPIERLKNVFVNHHAHWHDVCRTSEGKKAFKVIEALEINDIKGMLRFQIYFTTVSGKNRRTTDDPYYYHQANTERVEGCPAVLDKQWVKMAGFDEKLAKLISALSVWVKAIQPGSWQELTRSTLMNVFLHALHHNEDKNHAIDHKDFQKMFMHEFKQLHELSRSFDHLTKYLIWQERDCKNHNIKFPENHPSEQDARKQIEDFLKL